MKWIIASDIHGSKYYCEKLIERFNEEKADKILLLGDILYHGPRNDLPGGHDPKGVIEILNGYKDKILCVRGNCDAEVDQMVLEFPIMADYLLISQGDMTIFATHGHIYNENNLPPMGMGDIILNGHTHISKCQVDDGFIYMNPGSVSIPKGGTPNGYMTMEDGLFIWKTLDGEEFNRYKG